MDAKRLIQIAAEQAGTLRPELVRLAEKPPTFRLAEPYAPPQHWPHGTPYRIADDQVEARDIEQAHAIVTRDRSTLDETESNRAQVRIEEVCFRIQCRCFGDDETTLVWYHPDTRDFWAYPGAPL